MNVFGIGLPEMALIGIVALLVFGPKKLPEIGRSFGKALRGFQEASKEFETEFKREAEQIQKVVAEPMQATLEEKRALTGVQEQAHQGVSDDRAIAERGPIEAEAMPPGDSPT